MKIAVISDIHGNLAALDAVLDDAAAQGAEQIICAGDVPDPFQDSLKCWQRLSERHIPCLRGNHEDYAVAFYTPGQQSRFESANMFPIALVAQHLGPDIACHFAGLPLGLLVEGPSQQSVFVCHGTPSSNVRSYFDGIDGALERELDALDAALVVNGHRHVPWDLSWKNKTLVSSGSVGLPIHGAPKAEYVLLSHLRGVWQVEHRCVDFEVQGTLRSYRESGWIEAGGPLAWLLYDELQCSSRRLSTFWKFLHDEKFQPLSLDDWKLGARRYLESIGRWSALKSQLKL